MTERRPFRPLPVKSCVRLGLCVLVASARAWAGPFEDGIAAYHQQQFATALGLWLPLAEQGHAAAHFNTGVLYENGLGVAPDPVVAAQWYLKAAEQGNVEAQYKLALFYENGIGVEKDLAAARRWYYTVLANHSTDPGILQLKARARTRLASFTSVSQEMISFKGGRFVIARSTDGDCVVALQGTITSSAASAFDDVIRKASDLGCINPGLLLESPGGELYEGLELATKVRKAGFRTIVRSACASACAMIFLGGAERMLMGPGARIGLHQPSYGRAALSTCDTTTYTSAAREMADHVKSSVPAHAEQIIDLIRQTPCYKIEWVYGRRALDLGIATRLD